jgi:hypothetical protein
MRTTLRTLRVKAGWYISADGQWTIHRVTEGFPPRKVWRVTRAMDGDWKFVKQFDSLSAARMFITENAQGWWG